MPPDVMIDPPNATVWTCLGCRRGIKMPERTTNNPCGEHPHRVLGVDYAGGADSTALTIYDENGEKA